MSLNPSSEIAEPSEGFLAAEYNRFFGTAAGSMGTQLSKSPMEVLSNAFRREDSGVYTRIVGEAPDFSTVGGRLFLPGTLTRTFEIEFMRNSVSPTYGPFTEEEIILLTNVSGKFSDLRIEHSFDPVKGVIDALRALGYSACAKRIDFLYRCDDDDCEEGEKPLSQESAKGFLSFMTKFRYLGEPALGLFSEGTLSANWRIADDKHLLIEPVDSNQVSFALIGPSSMPDDELRLNGRGTIDDVISTLRNNGVDKWRRW